MGGFQLHISMKLYCQGAIKKHNHTSLNKYNVKPMFIYLVKQDLVEQECSVKFMLLGGTNLIIT